MAASLVLASGSPRRRELLGEAGYRFEVEPPDVVEISTSALTLREHTLCNATRKGLAVARCHPDVVVLAADTLVALDGEPIGKPADFGDAIAILRRLSGRTHVVDSAVVVCHLARGRFLAFNETSRVTFRRLSKSAIRDYLSKIDPLDKAGAYAAQGHGTEVIERIDGSYTNVVGLPMEKTVAVLADFGIKPGR